MTKEEAMESVEDRIQTGVARVREGLSTVDEKARTFIATRPVTALVCALGLGYVIGRVISRT